jgi:hypothetical protein
MGAIGSSKASRVAAIASTNSRGVAAIFIRPSRASEICQ